MENLLPTFDVPADVSAQSGQQQDYTFNPSAAFDFKSGDFVRDGAHRIVQASPRDTWIQWCLKTVYTQRYACLAYSDDIGTEFESLSDLGRAAAESGIERTITEAILADPMHRANYVGNFTFQWDNDAVDVTFSVYSADGSTADISASLS